jgi:hypothetical protein
MSSQLHKASPLIRWTKPWLQPHHSATFPSAVLSSCFLMGCVSVCNLTNCFEISISESFGETSPKTELYLLLEASYVDATPAWYLSSHNFSISHLHYRAHKSQKQQRRTIYDKLLFLLSFVILHGGTYKVDYQKKI